MLTSLFSTIPKAEALVKKSANILDVFTKTMNDLNSVNSEIDEAVVDLDVKIMELQNQKQQLNQTFITNAATITNITKILS